jgi:anhydro-N-acetylmuramic acid kinase
MPAMLVAGVMSGTSADGIDVAIVRLMGRGFQSRFQLLSHKHFAYPTAVRRAVLAAMNAQRISVADLARLNFVLGELYAEAVTEAAKEAGTKIELVGCHGQTLYHQGAAEKFLGREVACTWQTGEGAVIAARVGMPVISDFRVADMAAGGQGAPLVPYLDYLLYRNARRGRIVQNIGGIGNLTAIPAGAKPEQVVAFDTGPGNMVMDALAETLFDKAFDRDGKIAAAGTVIEPVVVEVMRAPFFKKKTPKTAGREQFGREFVKWFVARCRAEAKSLKRRASGEDLLATATALTARSIAMAVRSVGGEYKDYIVSGGGARNKTLMKMIGAELAPLNLKITTTDEHGLPSEAKEAAAFAVLAYETWHREASNVPSATGAKRAVVLGKVSYF